MSLLWVSLCNGVDISDFKTVEMPGKCFYVSELKLWPYQNNDDTINYAKQACLDLNLELAKLNSEDEINAVHQYLSKFSVLISNTIIQNHLFSRMQDEPQIETN